MQAAFTKPINDFFVPLAANYVPGSGTLVLVDVSRLTDGFPSSTSRLRLSVDRARDGAKTILVADGRTGNMLTGVAVAEGKSDIPLDAGDVAKCRLSEGYIEELQVAHNDLAATVDSLAAEVSALPSGSNTVLKDGSYPDPEWIESLSGSKIVGDIAGNAMSITGPIEEDKVTGLAERLAAIDASLDGLEALVATKANDSEVAHLSGAAFTGNVSAAFLSSSGGIATEVFGCIGANSIYLVNRRDTGVASHGFYSQAGEFSVYSYLLAMNILSVSEDGVISGDGSGLTGILIPTVLRAAAAANSIFLSLDDLDINGDPMLVRRGSGSNYTVIG